MSATTTREEILRCLQGANHLIQTDSDGEAECADFLCYKPGHPEDMVAIFGDHTHISLQDLDRAVPSEDGKGFDLDGARYTPYTLRMSDHMQHEEQEAHQEGDAVDRITVVKRLLPFVDLDKDAGLTDPYDLVSAIYSRVHLAHRIAAVEASGSWDYCKQAALDWLRKERRWLPVVEAAYRYQSSCVPPFLQTSGLMIVGEEYSEGYHLTFRYQDNHWWCCLMRPGELGDTTFRELPYARHIPAMGHTHQP